MERECTIMSSKLAYYIATSSLNRHDLFQDIRSAIEQKYPTMKLACDWPKLMDGFIERSEMPQLSLVKSESVPPFVNAGEKIAARFAIRDTEISAILNSQIIIVALPGGSGTFFEYGLAYAMSLSNPHAIVIVYAPDKIFVEEEHGHFIGLAGTVVVVGPIEDLVSTVGEVRTALFARRIAK